MCIDFLVPILSSFSFFVFPLLGLGDRVLYNTAGLGLIV